MPASTSKIHKFFRNPPLISSGRKFFIPLAWFIVITAIFALAYNQSPLFTSNQNQYFLHGYAQAGYGLLSEDWLSNTADPTPVFSSLVAGTLLIFHSGFPFYIYYALLMGIYFFSLYGILRQVIPINSSKLTFHVLFVAIVLLHSTVLRTMLLRIFGWEWSYLFEGGVAGQRLLGSVFQPSSFGVFLLLSIYLYLKDKEYLAVLSAVLAATIHPTYLLSAGALTLAYCIDTILRRKKIGPAIRMGLLALITIAPILAYSYVNFWTGTLRITRAAHDLLVHERIPYHTQVALWFDATVVIKLVFVGLGIFLARKNRLSIVLLIPLVLSIGLTIAQVMMKKHAPGLTLALLFPWRVSTWLVPVSVGLITAALVSRVIPAVTPTWERIIKPAGYVLIFLAVGAGVIRTYLEKVESGSLSYRPIEAFVAAHRQAGQQYLIPSKLYDFRLEAGVPIYIDFLSIPYKSTDVLEWRRRSLLANRFYQEGTCDNLVDFLEEGITHVILPDDFPENCPRLHEIYADRAFHLYELIQ